MNKEKAVRKAVHWLLLIVTIAFFVTGLGITEYRAVESISLGVLDKATSFAVHTSLTWPFIVLLALHLYLTVIRKWTKRK